MTSLKLAIHKVMPNSEALWINDKELWTSVNYIIYYAEALDSEPQKIADLKTPFLMKELSKLRLATRALRLGVRSFLRLRSGTIIVVAKSMDDGKTWDVGVGKAQDKTQVSFSRDERYLESFKVVLKNVYKWSCDNKENIDKSAEF